MSDAPQIIRLEIDGPVDSGLQKLDLDPVDFQSDLPEQYIHYYHSDPELGLTVGVWTTTSMQESFGPYPGDEFMCILEGKVRMIDGDGGEILINEGDAFCVRNATQTSWKQEGFLRKFFIIHDPPSSNAVANGAPDYGVFVLNNEKLSNELRVQDTSFPFEFDHAEPVQKDAPIFLNQAQNMHVGMWESEPFESAMRPFPCNEFVQLRDGEVTITEESGLSHKFSAGDTFFIPRGTVCAWKAHRPVRSYYCMIV